MFLLLFLHLFSSIHYAPVTINVIHILLLTYSHFDVLLSIAFQHSSGRWLSLKWYIDIYQWDLALHFHLWIWCLDGSFWFSCQFRQAYPRLKQPCYYHIARLVRDSIAYLRLSYRCISIFPYGYIYLPSHVYEYILFLWRMGS